MDGARAAHGIPDRARSGSRPGSAGAKCRTGFPVPHVGLAPLGTVLYWLIMLIAAFLLATIATVIAVRRPTRKREAVSALVVSERHRAERARSRDHPVRRQRLVPRDAAVRDQRAGARARGAVGGAAAAVRAPPMSGRILGQGIAAYPARVSRPKLSAGIAPLRARADRSLRHRRDERHRAPVRGRHAELIERRLESREDRAVGPRIYPRMSEGRRSLKL